MDTVVRVGEWLYAGRVAAGVEVLASDEAYDAHDGGEPYVIKRDCFYVVWASPGENKTASCVGPFDVLDEAIAYAESQTNGTLRWLR